MDAKCLCCGDPAGPGHTPMTLEYECPDCGYCWSDQWCSAVNDECPECGAKDIEPVEVIALTI